MNRLGGPRYEFNEFCLDVAERRLLRNGVVVPLAPKVFDTLLLLVANSGHLVEKDEFMKKLWPDTFVGEDALARNISILRRSLGGNSDTQTMIATVPKRGYRFVADVEVADSNEAGPVDNFQTADLWHIRQAIREQAQRVGQQATAPFPPGSQGSEKTETREADDSRSPALRRWTRGALPVLTVVVAGFASGLISYWALVPAAAPKVTRYLRLTNDGATKMPSAGCCPPVLVSDGSRVYFTEKPAGAWVVAEVSANGGDVATIPSPYQETNNVVFAISPNRSELLISPWEGWELATPLWVQSLPGGAARRVGGLMVNDANWSLDGESIVYGKGRDLYVANAEGSKSRKLATLPGIVYLPRQSPDRSVFRATEYDVNSGRQSLWEIPANGSAPHPLFPGNVLSDDCCGNWTADGKYFVFESTRDGATHIWGIRERGGVFQRRSREPVQLTVGPMDFLSPALSPDGRTLFVIGQQPRGELQRYDRPSQQFVTYLSGISAQDLDFQRGGKWVAFVTYPESILWRSGIDGTNRLQLTDPSLRAASPSISPDGEWIAFMGAKANGPWKIYLMPANGGSAEPLLPGGGAEWNPSWSPKGDAIVFGESLWSLTASIHLLDVGTRQASTLPGSQGLFYPHWSPDGRFILATTTDSLKLLLFDVRSQTWQELLRGHWISSPTWSRNSEYVYFCDLQQPAMPFYRVRVSDHKLERVVDVNVQRGLAGGVLGRWTGLAPDNSPLILRETGTQEIFALDLQLP
jgi:DNA-binding winged helix-turn-helix (wHTH) protein/Tol biopolymer transport system component